jgi:hypothetical protein
MPHPDNALLVLPPPNRFKKNTAVVMVNPEQRRVINTYMQVHRREAIEIELSSSPSSSPKQNGFGRLMFSLSDDDVAL